MRVTLAALPLFACATLSAQQSVPGADTTDRLPEVVTSAQGETRVTPDRATISIGVQTRARTAAEASAENARKQRAVIDTLRAMGIPPEHLSTAEYNVYPEQVFNPERGDKAPRITGYNVTNTVRAEIRKIDQIGRLVDAALAKGANGINSLQFYASNLDQARRSALAAAMARARGDAQALAQAAGGRLGTVLDVSSVMSTEPPRPVPMAMERSMAADAPTPIVAGQQTVIVVVTARFRLVTGAK